MRLKPWYFRIQQNSHFSSSLCHPFWILASLKIFQPNSSPKYTSHRRGNISYMNGRKKYFFPAKRENNGKTIFIWTVPETSNTKYLELIEKRSKVPEKNMSCERALNFGQWKTFSENYNKSLIMACLQIYRELSNLPTFPSSFKLKRGILPLLTKYVP